ncbi:MAG TPA: hypothetical protein PLO17_11955, partial [Alcaligenes phenolicus]
VMAVTVNVTVTLLVVGSLFLICLLLGSSFGPGGAGEALLTERGDKQSVRFRWCLRGDGLDWVFRQDAKKPALKRAFLIGTYLSRANKNRGFYGG